MIEQGCQASAKHPAQPELKNHTKDPQNIRSGKSTLLEKADF